MGRGAWWYQMGQWFPWLVDPKVLAQARQRHKWRHGSTSVSLPSSRHTTQSFSCAHGEKKRGESSLLEGSGSLLQGDIPTPYQPPGGPRGFIGYGSLTPWSPFKGTIWSL